MSLILLRLIIIAPQLMALLQNFVQLGLLLGFGSLTTSIFMIIRSDPPVIEFSDYSYNDLKFWAKLNLFISIVLIIVILLPPTAVVSPGFTQFFSIVISMCWLIYYLLFILWIITYWKIILKENKMYNIPINGRIAIHTILGICIALYWALETISLIITQEAISNIDFVNISYIILLIPFLFNQVLLYYKVTKFAYEIYG